MSLENDQNGLLEKENKALSDKLKEKEDVIKDYVEHIRVLENEIERYRNFENMYYTISNSTTWKMTKPVRVVLDKTKELLNRNATTRLIYHGLRYLKNNGIEKTIHKTLVTVKDMKKISEVNEIGTSDEITYRNGYWSIYEDEEIFEGKPDVKVLAFYLPQFHSFPENDKWWGKGFTEWTNTRKARPLYEGHYQPREPHSDIGYYNLTNIEYIKKQAKLAKNHGIYGFCIYHYWFSGKRLMEKPLDLILEHPEIDINFCICWANENWTRRWDGQEQDVLIAQKYSDDDPIKFIEDLKKYIDDKRYIKVNGVPIILVYNPASIPNVKAVMKKWKEVATDIGIGEISIWMCTAFGASIDALGLEDVVDREVEFPPHGVPGRGIGEYIPGTDGSIFNYSKMVNNIVSIRKDSITEKRKYYTAMMGWDNSARRKSGYSVFDCFDLKKYYDWLILNMEETRKNYLPEERFTFINAWNEWAEGTYLEPDIKYGYANINTTSRAIYNLPFGIQKDLVKCSNVNSRICVQAHIFYEELLDEFISYTNNISEEFDCYITTDSVCKAYHIFDEFKEKSKANKIEVLVVDNRGRDVAPMFMQLNGKIVEYEYLCHIHTKKTKFADYGDDWRKYLLNRLLGTVKNVEKIIEAFDSNEKLGIVYPEPYEAIKNQMIWYKEKETAQEVVNKINLNINLDEELDFPGGNMFWCRTEAVKQLFDNIFTEEDFPREEGQKYGTVMHSIERIWSYLVRYNGYTVKKM